MPTPDEIATAQAAAQSTPKPKEQQPDWSQLSGDAPTLSQMLTQDPDFAVKADKDIASMAALEASARGEHGSTDWTRNFTAQNWVKFTDPAKYFTTDPKGVEQISDLADAVKSKAIDLGGDISQGWQQGRRAAPLYKQRFAQALGDPDANSPEQSAKIQALSDSVHALEKPGKFDRPGYANFMQGALGKAANMAGSMSDDAGMILGATAAGAGVGAGIGAATGSLVGGVGALPGLIAGAKTGGAQALTGAMALQQAQQAGGQFYDEMLRTTLPDGSRMDPGVAAGGAIMLGVVNGALGALPIAGTVMGGLTERLTGAAGAQTMRKLMVNPAVSAILARFAKGFAVGTGVQAATGALQEISTIIAEQGVSFLSTGGTATTPLNLSRIPEAAVNTAQAGMGLSAIEGYAHADRSGKSLKSAVLDATTALNMYDNFGRAGREISVYQTDREQLGNFIDGLAKSRNIQDNTFPAKALQELLDLHGITGDKLTAMMPEVARQLADAGPEDRVRVTPRETGAYLAPLDGFDKIKFDMRGGTGLSMRELSDLVKESKKPGQLPPAPEMDPDIAAIHAEVYPQLKAAFPDAVADNAARFYAESVNSLSHVSGISAGDIHKEWGVNFVKKMASQLDNRAAGIPGATVENADKFKFLDLTKPVSPVHADLLANLRDIVEDRVDRYNEKAGDGLKMELPKSLNSGTNAELFDLMAFTHGSKKAVAGTLARMGYDGVDTGSTKVVWHPDALVPKSDPFRVQGKTTFEPGNTTVAFSEHANPSTAIHEMSHVLLRMWEKHAPDSPEFKAILSLFGGEDGTGSGDPASVLTTKGEENFADTMIEHLKTGKSPSLELNSVFAKFKGWMADAYKANSGVPQNRFISAVMDSLVASRDAVARAKQELISPMFANAKEAGMTETEFAKYQRLLDDAAATSESALDRQLLSHISTEGIKKFNDERIKARAGLIETEPVHSLRSFAETGSRLDGGDIPMSAMDPSAKEPAVTESKMDTDGLRRAGATPEQLEAMKGLHKKGGLDPDSVAPAFGYHDTQEMIQALTTTPDLDSAALEVAQKKMPGFSDPSRWIGDRAIAAMSNTVPQVLHAEYQALGGPLGDGFAEAMRMLAKKNLEGVVVQSLVPEHFLAEYRALGEQSKEAHVAGDIDEAMSLKRKQIVAFESWRLALTALEDSAKFSTLALQLRDDPMMRSRLARPGLEHLSAVDATLAAYGFDDPSKPTQPRDQPIGHYIDEQMKKNHADFAIDPELAFREYARNQAPSMTVAGLRNAKNFLESLVHHINQVDEFNGGVTPKELQPLVQRLVQHIQDNFAVVDRDNRSWLTNTLAKGMRWAFSDLFKPEVLLATLDKDTHGLLGQTVFQPIVEAESKGVQYKEAVKSALLSYIKEAGKDWLPRMNEKTDFRVNKEGTDVSPVSGKTQWVQGRVLSKGELVVALINFGNDANKQALLKGYGLDESALRQAFEKHLNMADINFAHRIWQVMEQVYPMVEDTYRNRTGVDMGSVKPQPFTLNLGNLPGGETKLTGGYYPIKYESKAATNVNTRYSAEDFDSTKVGDEFTLRRDGSYGAVNLDPSVMVGHLNRKIHYATMYPAVQEVNKIISHPDFQKAITNTIGNEYNKTLTSWLTNVARDGMPSEALSAWDYAQRYAMSGVAQATIGLNYKTGLMQSLGLIPAAGKVNPVHMALAFRDIMANWNDSWETAKAESTELRRIGTNDDSERWKLLMPDFTVGVSVETQFKNMGRGKLFRDAASAQDFLQQVGISHLLNVQQFANLITYMGAKREAMAAGRVDPVAYADAAVRQSQGGSGVKDLPGILAKPGMVRGEMMFYSYVSVLSNELLSRGVSLVDSYHKSELVTLANLKSTTVALATYLLLPNLAHYMINQKYKDKPGADSDADWFLRNQIGTSAARMIPGAFGEAASEMIAPDQPGKGNMGGPGGVLAGKIRSTAIGFTPGKTFNWGSATQGASMLLHLPMANFYTGLNEAHLIQSGRVGDISKAYSVWVRGPKKEGIVQ